MTETNTVPTRRVWRQTAIALVLIGGGFALGGASFAAAHGDMAGEWHHGWHHHGDHIGMIQRKVRGALDNVGATTAQEDKIHDIIANAATAIAKDGDEHGAMRKQILDLMKAPTLDKAAFEKLRADKIAAMEAKSKTITDALFSAASQLSPEQRVKLVDTVEEHMDHHGWHHHHDGMDGPNGGDDGHGDHDHGGRGPGAPDHG